MEKDTAGYRALNRNYIVGGDYKYGSWEIEAVTADAKAGLSLDYIGAQAGGRLFSAEGGVKIPIPLTEKSLFLGAEGELFAVGFKSYIKDGKIKIGVSAIIGGAIEAGIVDR